MWLDGEWSRPCLVLAEDGPEKWNHQYLDFPGVYRLVALADPRSKQPKTCTRICGGDDSGTLYIGQSRFLHGRISLRVRSTDPNSRVRAYPDLPDVLTKSFPVETLAVTWQQTESIELALKREAYLLQAYVTCFGERPPLNGQGGKI